MLELDQMSSIIAKCREIGGEGLSNGVKANIPELLVDILVPPFDFLGTGKNSAIFVNKTTHNLLGQFHENWILERTIALKEAFLQQAVIIEIIGAIIHETGHAFNVAAGIPNTETNAHIFEIEVMRKLLATKSPLLFGCTEVDVQTYFRNRLSDYNLQIQKNRDNYLVDLVKEIKEQFSLEDDKKSFENANSQSTWCTLFATKQWRKEFDVIMQSCGITPEARPY
mgnify:CR=1 FL=1